jgi:pyruvate/2-oxoglutarate dehydrogenase complex dihydrolipoamide dehydrogenase (E3) component
MAIKYNAIVIGTGQAGPSLAVRLADTGMKVAIIERKRFGGTGSRLTPFTLIRRWAEQE